MLRSFIAGRGVNSISFRRLRLIWSGARAAGVRKAPRHEIAVGEALAVPRALWGIERGVGVEENDTKRSRRWLWTEAWVSLQG